MQSTTDTHDPGFWVATEETNWDGWHVTSHWFEVAGQVHPYGVDVRSYTSEDHPLGRQGITDPMRPFLPSDRPQAVTRSVFESLPLGQILREHKRRAWAQLEDRSRRVADTSPETSASWAAMAEELSAPRRRSSPRDELYREVARFYVEAEKVAPEAPAEYVRIKLEQHGESLGIAYELDQDRRDLKNVRVQVRKWIAAARRRGYLPPKEGNR